MDKRRIGKSKLEVFPFALGGNVFGWTANKKNAFEILDAYTEAGFNLIDTANVYSAWVPGHKGGESETILGEWLKQSGKRDQIVLTTKVGAPMSPERKGLKKAAILREAEASLRRLQTDYIDLYFTHYDDTSLPVEEPLEAYAVLVQEGKVREIGASNMSGARIGQALEKSREYGYPEYVCLQPLYNLYDRMLYEREYEPLAREYGLGVMSYYSLASGFLTGKYKFGQELTGERSETVKKYMDDRGQRILEVLEKVAAEWHATPAQVALAWLMAQPTVTAPIASVSKASQLDILKAVELNLSTSVLHRLEEVSQPFG